MLRPPASTPAPTRVRLLALLCLGLSALSSPVAAQPPGELRATILTPGKALFDAFHACDLETWKRYLAEDIEFYQDNDDVTPTRQALEPSFKDRCGSANVSRLRRELLPDTVDVHPIQGYGAVQLGSHGFWIMTGGVRGQLASTPKFVHLWRHADGVWQITRVISYGH